MVVDITDAYNAFIIHHPFYEFPFFTSANRFWSIFYNSLKVSCREYSLWNTLFSDYMLMDTFIGITMTLEFYLKALISLPLNLFLSDTEATYRSVIAKDPLEELQHLSPEVEILGQQQSSSLIAAKFPRHRDLLKTLEALSKSMIQILEISGNPQITLKVRYPAGTSLKFCPLIPQCRVDYSYVLPSDEEALYSMVTLPVTSLLKAFRTIALEKGKIVHVHDY